MVLKFLNKVIKGAVDYFCSFFNLILSGVFSN